MLAMHVTTDIPCGNGRIHWLDPENFEVELIAYSKQPRYTHFQIDNIRSSGTFKIVLRPDSFFTGARFSRLALKIWIRHLPDGDWFRLPDDKVRIAPEKIEFDLELTESSRLQISTEPPRPYGNTCMELMDIAFKRPSIAQIHIIGASIESRPILLLRVTDQVQVNGIPGAEKRPVAFFMSGEHATEFAGEELNRGMLQAALGNDELGSQLRERYVLDFVLNANPDGNYHGWHQYNAQDWKEHNYYDGVDRSWHHEYESFFLDPDFDASPETQSIGRWIQRTSPRFIHSAHSWLGHNANLGSFRVEPKLLDPDMAEIMERIDNACIRVGSEYDIDFEIYKLSNLCSGHIGDYMVTKKGVPTYCVEGHIGLGRERLQAFGRRLIEEWLINDGLNI